MTSFPNLNPLSTVRESKVIANQQTIANQTQIITPSNTKFKRTVFHTPAIIQTIVDTPETPIPAPSVVRRPPVGIVSRAPVTRVETRQNHSVRYLPQPSTVVRQREDSMIVGGPVYEREIGVKVKEDLSGFRPSVGVTERREVKEGCGGVLGYCWGHRCPFWICILLPILLVLLLLGLSWFINRHRVFYGYDTSTINNRLNTGENGNVNVDGSSSNGNWNESVVGNTGTEVVSPIVSTDIRRNQTITTSSTNSNQADLNSNSNLNAGVDTNVDPNVNTNIDTNAAVTPNPFANSNPNSNSNSNLKPSLTGGDIYSRVLSRQQQNQLSSPQTTQTTSSITNITSTNDGLVNQSPGILNNSTATETTETNVSGIRLAPTIEELKTRLMIEAERAEKAGGKSHMEGRKMHLRYYVH